MTTKQLTNHDAQVKAQQATNRLIFIVGPTATGKTNFALQLAQEIHADILSADSRQVYKNLEITTGLDLPPDWQKSRDEDLSYFTFQGIQIYGLNFLEMDQEWSIAHFRDLAEQVFKRTTNRGKKLIIVGGSGLYHQSLFLQQEILKISPSTQLRETLSRNSVAQLQNQLVQYFPSANTTLNNSDWNNPRRLIRWIEKMSIPQPTSLSPSLFGTETDHLWIGLKPDEKLMEDNIRTRVITRIDQGSIQEIEKLLAYKDPQHLPSFSTLGVKDLSLFIQDRISKEELIELWTKHELQYAKRQMTWFKKRLYIQWTDLPIFKKELIAQIKRDLEPF